MAWKILQTGIRRSEPRITLTRGKYIRFSPAFIKDNKLDERRYVKIYIDKKEEKSLVGFEFLDDKEDKILKLSKNKSSDGAYCSGSSLFKELGLKKEDMPKSLHFSPSEEKFEKKEKIKS